VHGLLQETGCARQAEVAALMAAIPITRPCFVKSESLRRLINLGEAAITADP